MKIRVIALSFAITSFLSFSFLIPQLIKDGLQEKLIESRAVLAQSGIKLEFEDISLSYIPLTIRVDKLKIFNVDGSAILRTHKIELSKWSLSELIRIQQGELSLSDVSKLRISIYQAEVAANYLSPEIVDSLQYLGYDRMILNLVSEFDYDSVKKEFFQKELSIEGQNMGKLTLSFHLFDFDMSSAENIRLKVQNSSLKALSVKYVDASLVRTGLAPLLKDPELVGSYLAFIDSNKSQRDPAGVPFKDKIQDEFQKFLIDPRELKVEVKPEAVVPFKDISLMLMLTPENLFQTLHPEIKINDFVFNLEMNSSPSQ